MLSPGSSHFPWLLGTTIFFLYCSITLGGFSCLSNPCLHGVCIDDLNTTYSCYCIDGYTGIQCQTNWDECWSNPCQNGATCNDGIAMFNCTCPPGFVGDLCQEDYNECESNPCLNNGTCIDRTNGYTCVCMAGYSGVHCEIDIAVCNATNETRCANGGICVEGPGITFSCNCQPGWGGVLCESEINECMSAPCQNGAVCIDLHADYACACLFGYTGKNCEEVILQCKDNPCKNGALCLTEDEHPVCYCVPDFHGERCQYQYDECQLGPRCMNGGTCIDGIDSFTCSCPPNLTGVLCECLIIGTNDLDCTYTITTFSTISTGTTSKWNITTTEAIPELTTTSEELDTILFSQVPNASTISTPITTTIEGFTPSLVYSTEITTLFSEEPEYFNMSSTRVFDFETTTKIQVVSDQTTTEMEEPSVTTTEITVIEVVTEKETTSQRVTESTTEAPTTEEPTATTEEAIILNTTLQVSETTTEIHPVTSTEFFETPTQTPFSPTFDTSVSSTTSEATTTEFEHPTTITIEQTMPPTISIVPTTSTETTEIVNTILSSVTPFLTEKPLTIPTIHTETTIFPEFTTFGRENATKAIITDCNKPGFHCQNGGTCVYSEEGYKCVCPYDAEGSLCEVKLGIRNAAFGGDSYLTHRLINSSGVEIEFMTKTLSPSGLIFYSNIDKTYMGLYLEGGYLKFIFSCGYQTMLLSELRNPVNDGFEMHVKAELEFSKDFKRCNATVMVNNTLTMSGNQVAIVNHLMKPISVLHLGGLPQEKLKELIPSVGFMGCITGLKIFGKPVDVFTGAEDGFKISECSSLACLSNPCSNGGTCIEDGDNWRCHCKNGYLGKLCENSICENNPCLFGATCLPFTGSGYICLCPFGKHGHFCENDLEITEPYFSSSVRGFSSYAAYPIPTGGISSNMELKFKFTPSTMDQISILMFIGQTGLHDASSDHMAVSFVKGYIMLTWNLGSGPRRIFTSTPILKDKNSYMLRLGRFGRRAWISVDNMGNITGRSPGNLAQLDVVPILYLGGHNSPNFSILPHDLPLHNGFSGCIFDVELKSGNLVIPLQSSRQVVGRALGQCGTTECHENLCQNGGACLYHGGTFTCLCQDGWFGPLCSSRYNPCDFTRNNCSIGSNCVPLLTGYECDCSIGRTGKFCENDQVLSDVSLSGRRSYILLKPVDFEHSKFTIELQLRPLSDRGMVLFIGDSDSFLSLIMQSGLLELRVLPAKRKLNGNEVISIRSNQLLAMGVWYTVRLGKYGNKLLLYVDNTINTGVLHIGDDLSISQENIFLGGLPDLSELPFTATPSLPVSFTGCIRQLQINSRHIPLTLENIIAGRNVQDCDGTPCGGDACENGGTCWLDSNLTPHCTCPEPYMGEKCQMVPSCADKPCENRGRCLNSRCICIVGYTGAFCETAFKVQTPEFLGDSHLILKKIVNDKKRELQNSVVYNLYLNFTSAAKDGLILWSFKGRNFVGLGIEKGYVKLAYSIENINETVVEVFRSKFIADGLWHAMEISFTPLKLYLRLDRKLLQIPNKLEEAKRIDAIFIGDTFFLGGLPPIETQLEGTRGLFPKPFVGCIESVIFNKEQIITDFSNYEGENVGVCSVH